MRKAITEAMVVGDGKLCQDCDGFKVLGHFAKDRLGVGQCRTRRWNPRGDRAACGEFTERKEDIR